MASIYCRGDVSAGRGPIAADVQAGKPVLLKFESSHDSLAGLQESYLFGDSCNNS